MSEIERRREAWDRQPGESGRAFAAFQIYRDMGPTRSLLKVARSIAESTPSRKGTVESIRSQLSRWASVQHWAERCAAYEQALDHRRIEQREEQRAEMERRHLAISYALLDAARARAEGLERDEDDDVVALSPNGIGSWSELAKIAEVGVRIERVTHGLPVDISKSLSHIEAGRVTKLVYDIVDVTLQYVPEATQAAMLNAVERVCRDAS